jgi:hypothetical protein
MATPAQEHELQVKLTALIVDHYGGDWQKCFDEYSTGGLASHSQIMSLLAAAGVGNVFTRPLWSKGIIAELDTNGDGKISMDEIQAKIAEHERKTVGGALSIYGYFTITVAGGGVTHLHGAAEVDAKRLFAKGVTRLLRFSSGILSESLEEFDSVGWTSCTTETL